MFDLGADVLESVAEPRQRVDDVVAVAADPKGPDAARAFLDKLKLKNLQLYADPKLALTIATGGAPVLRAVATDGHRLALIDFAKESPKTAMPDVLVPKKAIAEILKMDGTGEEANLSIRHSENPRLHIRISSSHSRSMPTVTCWHPVGSAKSACGVVRGMLVASP